MLPEKENQSQILTCISSSSSITLICSYPSDATFAQFIFDFGVLTTVYPSLSECAEKVVEDRDFGVGALVRSLECPFPVFDLSD